MIFSAGALMLIAGWLFYGFEYEVIGCSLLVAAVVDLSLAITLAPVELRATAPNLFTPGMIVVDVVLMVAGAVFVIWTGNWVGAVPIIAVAGSFAVAVFSARSARSSHSVADSDLWK